MKKNVASQVVGCQLVSKTDGSPVTSGTTTVYVTGDGGTQATGSVGSGACTHEGHGFWTYAPAQAETNFDHVAFTFENSNAVNVTVQLYPSFPQTGDNFARLGAPAGASVSADIAAVKSDTAAILVDTGTTLDGKIDTIDTVVDAIKAKTDNLPSDPADQSLIIAATDALATLIGTPAGASVSADVAAVKADTAATLTDTNELQTDWANGGRLDLILDARASQTSVDDLPTNAELATALAAADDAVLAAVATVDANVDTMLATSAKLDDTLEDSGGGAFIFTTAALAQAPSGSGASAADIADAVWDEAIADHQVAGSTGEALNGAGSSGNPWISVLEGSLTAGDLLRVCAAFAAGKTAIVKLGNKLHEVTFRDITDSSDIIEATVNNSQRTAVTVTP